MDTVSHFFAWLQEKCRKMKWFCLTIPAMSKAVAKGIIVTWDLVGNLATETRWGFSLRHFFRLFLQQGSKPVGLLLVVKI